MDKNEIIAKSELKAICMEIINELLKSIKEDPQPKKKWVRSKTVQDRLEIAESTLRYWRDKRVITHSKIDNIYFYPIDEIDRILEKNKIRSLEA